MVYYFPGLQLFLEENGPKWRLGRCSFLFLSHFGISRVLWHASLNCCLFFFVENNMSVKWDSIWVCVICFQMQGHVSKLIKLYNNYRTSSRISSYSSYLNCSGINSCYSFCIMTIGLLTDLNLHWPSSNLLLLLNCSDALIKVKMAE